jgi:hypothetical protein
MGKIGLDLSKDNWCTCYVPKSFRLNWEAEQRQNSKIFFLGLSTFIVDCNAIFGENLGLKYTLELIQGQFRNRHGRSIKLLTKACWSDGFILSQYDL